LNIFLYKIINVSDQFGASLLNTSIHFLLLLWISGWTQ